MHWITDKVAIGDYREANDVDLLRQGNFRSILRLIYPMQDASPASLGVERIETIGLLDGAGNDPGLFNSAIDMLVHLVADVAPVLVHCRAGWSRSPAVVAGYLMRSQGLSVEQSLEIVRSKRPGVMVARELEMLLRVV